MHLPRPDEAAPQRFTEKVALYISILWHDKQGAKALKFTVAFFALMCVAFTVSWLSNSVVLTLNGFVLMYRVASLLSVCAGKVVMSRSVSESKSGSQYTFGLQRVEILAEYASLTVLMVSCLTCVVESLQKMLEPHDVHPVYVEFVCLIHIALVVLHAQSMKHEEVSRARRRFGSKGVVLFFIAEASSPIICITSCQLVAFTGYDKIDLFFAMLQTVCVVANSMDTIVSVASILLQRVDPRLKSAVDKAVREIEVVEGVLECRDYKCWVMSEGQLVVTVWLRLHQDAVEQPVLRAVNSILSPLVYHSTVHLEAFGEKKLVLSHEEVFGANSHASCSHGSSCGHNHDHGHSHSHGHNEDCSHSCGHNHQHHSSCSGHHSDSGEDMASLRSSSSGSGGIGDSNPHSQAHMVPLFPVPPSTTGPLPPLNITPRGPPAAGGHQQLSNNSFPSPPPTNSIHQGIAPTHQTPQFPPPPPPPPPM